MGEPRIGAQRRTESGRRTKQVKKDCESSGSYTSERDNHSVCRFLQRLRERMGQRLPKSNHRVEDGHKSA